MKELKSRGLDGQGGGDERGGERRFLYQSLPSCSSRNRGKRRTYRLLNPVLSVGVHTTHSNGASSTRQPGGGA